MIHLNQTTANTTKMDIGSKIKIFRIQKNLKQEDLAKGIISVSYLSKIENNLTSLAKRYSNFYANDWM